MSAALYAIDELPPRLADLHAEVRSWRLEPALTMLSRLGWYEPPDPPNPAFAKYEQWLEGHQHDLAYLAKVIVLRCDPFKGASPSLDDIINAISESLGASEAALLADLDESKQLDEDSLSRFMNRMAAVQWRLRFKQPNAIVRTAKMFSEIPKRPEVQLELDWDARLEAVCGFTGLDVVAIFAGVNLNYGGGTLTRGRLVSAFDPTPYGEAQIDKFLATFGTDKARFVELAAQRQCVPPELEYYAFNPLDEFPLVRVAKGRYVLPSKLCFIKAVTSGLFWKIRNRLADDYQPGENPADRDLGIMLETYVRDVAQYYLDREDFVPEIQLAGRKWADTAILHGTEGLIVECKAHGFSLGALGRGDIEFLLKDLGRNIIPALEQAARNIRNISEAAGVEPRLGKIDSWLPLVVLYEASLPLNSPYTREAVQENLSPDDWGIVQDYQVLTVEEWEYLMASVKVVHPVDMIKAKIKREPHGTVTNSIIAELGDASGQADNGFFEEGWREIRDYLKAKYEQ